LKKPQHKNNKNNRPEKMEKKNYLKTN